MMKLKLNSTQFQKDMNNIIQYSYGFLDGIDSGKQLFLKNLGISIKEVLEEFIDANARVSPQTLHHVYEWYKTGSPSARLFDIDFTVSKMGLSFYSNFKQSTTVKDGSKVPFYNKAKIMEDGISVTIKPKNSNVLVFEDNGETVFTKNPITVNNPGGSSVQGSFEKIFDIFFNRYFTQAFLKSSGILGYLDNPVVYKKNLKSGKQMGRSKGISTGYAWIANAGVIK